METQPNEFLKSAYHGKIIQKKGKRAKQFVLERMVERFIAKKLNTNKLTKS